MQSQLVILGICVLVFYGYGRFLNGVRTHGCEPLISLYMRDYEYTYKEAANRVTATVYFGIVCVFASGIIGVVEAALLYKAFTC